MSHLDREVRRLQRRLWLNRWLNSLGWCLVIGIGLWIALWVPHRLFSMKWPMDTVALGMLGGVLVASIIWLMARREDRLAAASALDQAAGLRERTSTSVALQGDSADEFTAAVHHDAERSVTGIHGGRLLPVRWTGSLSLSAMMLVIAALSLLIPELDLLGRDDEKPGAVASAAEMRAKAEALKRPVSIIEKIAEQNPDVDLDTARKMDAKDLSRMKSDPGFVRREAKKQLNTLKDALKNKANADKFRAQREVNKRLRQIGQPEDPKSELRQLMNHMSAGDFAEAQEEVRKLQEKLAKNARDGKMDPEAAKKLKSQLNDLAKKLKEASEKQQAAQDKAAQQQLQNTGMTKEEAQRALSDLAKKDPEQLKKMAEDLAKRMQDKGVTKEQMEKLLDKLQQEQKAQQKANQQCNKMGDSMEKASKSMEEGKCEQAKKDLEGAGEQLSDMEQMEQALNDLESQMDDLQDAEESLEDFDPKDQEGKCDQCNGSGFLPDGAPCPKCQGNGQGNGQGQGNGNGQGQGNGQGGRGRAFGQRDRNDNVETGTRNVRAKTRNGRGGSVIGQQFVKGSQEKGDSAVEFSEAFQAGEIDATDSINRGHIPRKYKSGIRNYFDRIREDLDSGAAPTERGEAPDGGGAPSESDGDSDDAGDS